MTRDAEGKGDTKLPRLYDKRTVERSIKRGLLTRKDFEKVLKTLPDVSDKGIHGVAEPAEEPAAAAPAAPAEASSPAEPPAGTNNEH